jgi:DNA-binding transcriptional ArsR family regulator
MWLPIWVDAFDAVADPGRRYLLGHLARTGPARVVDLTRGLAGAGHPVSRPAVSKHLRVLTEAGLVSATTSGRERHYALVDAGLDPVRTWLSSLRTRPPVSAQALDALDLEVRRTVRGTTTSTRSTHDPSQEETA